MAEKDHKQNKKDSEDQSHKRTFSTGPEQNSVDDPSANDVPPPNKKRKCESQSDSESPIIPDTKITLDDGDELIPLTSQGPNIFYGFGDALLDLFKFGENQGPYWLKTVVMDRYKASGDQADDEWPEPLTYAGITCDTKNLQTPEAELLSTHFDGLSGNWWYEVTLKRQKPEGMRLQVTLESSEFDEEGCIWGGKDLGEWWISDIQAAEGESHEAMKTVHSTMF